MATQKNIFINTTDTVIFCSALILVFLIAGARLEQYVRSEQLANMVRASYELDETNARNEQLKLETEKLNAMRPVVESIYGYKNEVAKADTSGD